MRLHGYILSETAIKGLHCHLAVHGNAVRIWEQCMFEIQTENSQLEKECGRGLKTGKMPILGIQLQLLSCCSVDNSHCMLG